MGRVKCRPVRRSPQIQRQPWSQTFRKTGQGQGQGQWCFSNKRNVAIGEGSRSSAERRTQSTPMRGDSEGCTKLDSCRNPRPRFGGDMMPHETDSAVLDPQTQRHKGDSSGASPTLMREASGCRAAPIGATTRRSEQLSRPTGRRRI